MTGTLSEHVQSPKLDEGLLRRLDVSQQVQQLHTLHPDGLRSGAGTRRSLGVGRAVKAPEDGLKSAARSATLQPPRVKVKVG